MKVTDELHEIKETKNYNIGDSTSKSYDHNLFFLAKMLKS